MPMHAVFTAAQLSGKLRNPCFMGSHPALMACGVRRAAGARITTPPTRRLSLTKKGTRLSPHAHVGAPRRATNGTRPKGGRAAPIVNIFKGQNYVFRPGCFYPALDNSRPIYWGLAALLNFGI